MDLGVPVSLPTPPFLLWMPKRERCPVTFPGFSSSSVYLFTLVHGQGSHETSGAQGARLTLLSFSVEFVARG